MTSDPVLCGECNSTCALVSGKVIYPRRPDLWNKGYWFCPGCRAYCGCHPGGDRPLGSPAGPETRAARTKAHAAFDHLWKSGRMKRRDAYRWLAEAMGVEGGEVHIGEMTAAEARRVVEAVHGLRCGCKEMP